MKRISFIVLFLLGISGAGFAQGWDARDPGATWREANTALENNRLPRALELYRQVLQFCEANQNMRGKISALEALALVYKRLEKYQQAKNYCRQSINTGFPTYRAYYLLSQSYFEEKQQMTEAQKYCREGLKRFPQNEELLRLEEILHRQAAQYRSSKSAAGSRGELTLSPHRQTTPAYNRLNAAAYLNLTERNVIAEMNLARKNPSAYAHYLAELREFYAGPLLKMPGKTPVRTVEGVAAVDEAIAYLKKATPVPALVPSAGMTNAARDHVRDQSRTGNTGHTGYDGSEPYERLERYGLWEGLSGENIAYGDEGARMFVMQLIIDDGVPSRGHRDNIFNAEFRQTGVAIGIHPVYRTMCVITYASKFTEKNAGE